MGLLERLEANGLVHLDAGIDRDYAEALHAAVWEWLKALHGIDRNDVRTWKVKAPWVGLKDFKDDPIFDGLAEQPFVEAIDQLLDGQWHRPLNWGGFLVKFPDTAPGSWTVPANFWHVDFHYANDPSNLFGLRVFVLLSDVGARGGATLVVENSHRLVRDFVAGASEEFLAKGFAAARDRFNVSDPWLTRLSNPSDNADDRTAWFMGREATIRAITVRVRELLGRCGDVYLMHPWLVHSASPNASTMPRFMRAKDLQRLDVRMTPTHS